MVPLYVLNLWFSAAIVGICGSAPNIGRVYFILQFISLDYCWFTYWSCYSKAWNTKIYDFFNVYIQFFLWNHCIFKKVFFIFYFFYFDSIIIIVFSLILSGIGETMFLISIQSLIKIHVDSNFKGRAVSILGGCRRLNKINNFYLTIELEMQ